MTTAVIIGGGASALRRGWGHFIDKADFVVRMFDHSWQEPADYGTRYDAGFFMINQGPAFERWPRPSHLVMATTGVMATTDPTEWWGAISFEQFEPLIPAFKKRADFRLFKFYDLAERARALTPDSLPKVVLARGTQAAIAALWHVKPTRLILVGFDHMRAGCMTRSAHKPFNPATNNLRFVGKWDPVADRNLLNELTKGIEMRHALKDEDWSLQRRSDQ